MSMAGSEDEEILRRTRAKRRFKAFGFMAMNHHAWLNDMGDEAIGDDVVKNVRMITTRSNVNKSLSLKDKTSFFKRPWSRTKEEIKSLRKAIDSLPIFQHYPQDIKHDLADVLEFQYFGPGRTVVKEGHEPFYMYFLISGTVEAYKEFWDSLIQQKNSILLRSLESGNIFGEVGLLYDIAHPETIITKTACELLRINKTNFNSLLKSTVMEQWKVVREAMARFCYFDGWGEEAIRDITGSAKIFTYEENKTVLGDGVGSASSTYFILQGKCSVIQTLFLETHYVSSKKQYKLYHPKTAKPVEEQQSKTKRKSGISLTPLIKPFSKIASNDSINLLIPEDINIRFVQVCIYDVLSCFGIGESMQHRSIVTLTPTRLMIIPRYLLMTYNKNNVWNKVRQFLEHSIPDNKKVFEIFMEQRRWGQYREELFYYIAENTRNGPSFANRESDIPFNLRINGKITV